MRNQYCFNFALCETCLHTGEPFSWTNFGDKEPNGEIDTTLKNQDCLVLVRQGTTSHWKDDKCTTTQGVICERGRAPAFSVPVT